MCPAETRTGDVIGVDLNDSMLIDFKILKT